MKTHECKRAHAGLLQTHSVCVCVFADVEDEVETPGRPRLLLREAFRDSRWIGPNTALQRGEVV